MKNFKKIGDEELNLVLDQDTVNEKLFYNYLNSSFYDFESLLKTKRV